MRTNKQPRLLEEKKAVLDRLVSRAMSSNGCCNNHSPEEYISVKDHRDTSEQDPQSVHGWLHTEDIGENIEIYHVKSTAHVTYPLSRGVLAYIYQASPPLSKNFSIFQIYTHLQAFPRITKMSNLPFLQSLRKLITMAGHITTTTTTTTAAAGPETENTDSSAQPQVPGLLRLAPKIRLQIYSHVLHEQSLSITWSRPSSSAALGNGAWIMPPLRQCSCRRGIHSKRCTIFFRIVCAENPPPNRLGHEWSNETFFSRRKIEVSSLTIFFIQPETPPQIQLEDTSRSLESVSEQDEPMQDAPMAPCTNQSVSLSELRTFLIEARQYIQVFADR
ncbi:MAG: hypothetical protein LQ350_005860 [Teloschistes chrysophthalmus]|nr:MAG: hypothetical protein LQ350_005860 [Niorma chrysophthalma]